MATKKRALGRGLENFIKDVDFSLEEVEENQGKLKEVKIEDIKANINQPRKDFDPEMLEELAKSIKEVGILQPLIVKKSEEGFDLIAGERRLRAAKIAKLKEVPVLLVDITEEEVEKIALIENIQREDLNPLEEALAYERLKTSYGYTQEEMAQALGKSRSYIANTLRLLNLEEELKEYLQQGLINVSQAKILLGIKDPKKQIQKARSIIEKKATVQQTQSSLKSPNKQSPYERSLLEKLMECLGTKAEIRGKGKKTKLIIDLYTEEDLNRVVDIILGGENID